MASILKLFGVKSREPEKRPHPEGRREHVHLTNPWHAVSIVPGASCCSTARSLAGRRYLSSEPAPTVPLPGCSLAKCSCHYRHHDDRRSNRRATDRPVNGGEPQPRRRADDLTPH